MHVATEGKEWLDVVQKDPGVQLVISDILMKSMDGLDILKKCQEISPDMPVILTSRYSRDENIIEALRNGAYDYLIKPFEKEQLITAIERAKSFVSSRRSLSRFYEFVNHCQIEFVIKSQELSMESLQKAIRETLRNYTNLPSNELLNISMVLEEAVLNAHEHGNLELKSEWKEKYAQVEQTTLFEKTKLERLSIPDFAERQIRVHLVIERSRLEISVEDDGKGYKTGNITTKVRGTPHGMGLMIINNLMDEIKFNEKGNRITFIKYLDGTV